MVVNQRLTMFIEEHKDVVHAKEISLQAETCHLRLWGTNNHRALVLSRVGIAFFFFFFK